MIHTFPIIKGLGTENVKKKEKGQACTIILSCAQQEITAGFGSRLLYNTSE